MAELFQKTYFETLARIEIAKIHLAPIAKELHGQAINEDEKAKLKALYTDVEIAGRSLRDAAGCCEGLRQRLRLLF